MRAISKTAFIGAEDGIIPWTKDFEAIYLKEHFTEFYEAIPADPRIMQCAKVNARATYYKSLQDLNSFGYIKYIPSCNLFLGSLVYPKRI